MMGSAVGTAAMSVGKSRSYVSTMSGGLAPSAYTERTWCAAWLQRGMQVISALTAVHYLGMHEGKMRPTCESLRR